VDDPRVVEQRQGVRIERLRVEGGGDAERLRLRSRRQRAEHEGERRQGVLHQMISK
jgi:hypothetical protein